MPDRGQVFRFGSFELDCASRELRKNGLRLKLEEQPFRLLAFLISRHGDMVTREELRNALWSHDTYVDFERGLTRVINKVRLALADDAANPRFIETVPRRGYRFVAPVSMLDRSQEPQESSPAATGGPEPLGSSVRLSEEKASNLVARNTSLRIAWALIPVAALAGLLWFRYERPSDPPITAIAVLPVHHVDTDRTQDALAESTTDELIASISRIHSLRVVSFRSVIPYAESKKSLAEIARDRKVEALVDSSLHARRAYECTNVAAGCNCGSPGHLSSRFSFLPVLSGRAVTGYRGVIGTATSPTRRQTVNVDRRMVQTYADGCRWLDRTYSLD